MIGEQISHYKIESKIGSGGMGVVYLAQDTNLSRRVALKFLPESLCDVDEARKRFLRESQAVAALNHPNIVTIHEVAEHEGRPFFAMEHVDGRSLRDYGAEGTGARDGVAWTPSSMFQSVPRQCVTVELWGTQRITAR